MTELQYLRTELAEAKAILAACRGILEADAMFGIETEVSKRTRERINECLKRPMFDLPKGVSRG